MIMQTDARSGRGRTGLTQTRLRTRMLSAFAAGALFLLPLALADAPATNTKTDSEDRCTMLGVAESAAACSVWIRSTLTVLNGCAGDVCVYEVNTTAIGTAGRFGVLQLTILSMTPGVSACVTPVGDDPLGEAGACRRVCESVSVGAIVECHGTARRAVEVPPGSCAPVLTDATLSYYSQAAGTVAGVFQHVCHRRDGSVTVA